MKRSLTWLKTLVFVAAATPVALAAENTVIEQAWLKQSMTLADARHLAGRTGFGATAMELSALVGLSRRAAVQIIVDGIDTSPAIAMPAWVEQPAPRFWTRATLPREERQAFDRERDQEIAELRRWWVNNMLQSDSPQTERLVMFWHDHFATSYQGVNRRSISIARQNQLFRQMGTGSYRAFLKAMIRDPAMLIYLDNQKNRKGGPNENLARELLELFTLGEGNYDEATVKEAARALTGYGISETHNHSFRMHAYKHDADMKTLFGVTANHNGDSLIDVILEQPSAARHLVRKYWSAFVADSAPDAAFVDALADTFRQSDYDLLVLYTAVLQSREFWDERNRLALIKSPATLLLGTARSLDFPKQTWPQLPALHALLGMALFAPPNVSGWKEGAAFVAPGRLLNRQLAVKKLLDSSMSTQVSPSDAMMTNETMMSPMSTDVVTPDAPLQVKLAGHFFKGAPRFTISLYNSANAQEKMLWASEERELLVGYDTEMFGPMQDFGMLPFTIEAYSPPAAALSKATLVKIEFLNDAADKTGDRNLFVESVAINSQSFRSVGAKQVSACAPKNKRNAGNLYCAGTVSIDLNNELSAKRARVEPYTATDARVIWSNKKAVVSNKRKLSGKQRSKKSVNENEPTQHKLDVIIALENVQTPHNFYHTVSFHLVSDNEQSLQLRLDAFGCWPDCIDPWPECAWHAEHSNEKSVVFPLVRGSNKQVDCHYESLSSAQKQLVNALWKSMPDIIEHVVNNEARQRHAGNLGLWNRRITTLHPNILESDYVQTSDAIAIDAKYETAVVEKRELPEPSILIRNLTDLEHRVKDSELSLADLLIGGGDVGQLPELRATNDQSIAQQLEAIVSHPVYQVY